MRILSSVSPQALSKTRFGWDTKKQPPRESTVRLSNDSFKNLATFTLKDELLDQISANIAGNETNCPRYVILLDAHQLFPDLEVRRRFQEALVKAVYARAREKLVASCTGESGLAHQERYNLDYHHISLRMPPSKGMERHFDKPSCIPLLCFSYEERRNIQGGFLAVTDYREHFRNTTGYFDAIAWESEKNKPALNRFTRELNDCFQERDQAPIILINNGGHGGLAHSVTPYTRLEEGLCIFRTGNLVYGEFADY